MKDTILMLLGALGLLLMAIGKIIGDGRLDLIGTAMVVIFTVVMVLRWLVR